ncbi:MAG: acyl-CoA dehydrogenase [Lysobacterales bacterium]
MSLILNRRDLNFYLYELLGLEQLLTNDRYADFDRDTVDAVIDAAVAIAEECYQPLAAKVDANEPKFDNGAVTVMPEVAQAMAAFNEAGFPAAGFDRELGGMQLPWIVNQAVNGIFMCANTAVANYSFLSAGAANLLNTCGSDHLKDRFLPPMLDGRWHGTMCLSETQAGSSLADITTSAVHLENDRYRISGTKMWISGGDHDLSENIVHMVLAKIPGGPAGVKGISLFVVPKHRVDDEGNIVASNHVVTAGLNHKMGQRGTTNCLLNFGEGGECEGFLVGREHQGLTNMFHMMNEARIGVGLGSVMAALGGYLCSLDYAKERAQGRPLTHRDPASEPVKIIEHIDVKRMLMTQKAFVEGGQALIYYCASLLDQQKLAVEAQEIQRVTLLLELLTPVAKSWPAEYCLEANKLAIQVLGGYGYTRDFPVERFYRDNRLNAIHEGTHGIHGLDLLGRKVAMHNGAALKAYLQEVQETLDGVSSMPEMTEFAQALSYATRKISSTVAAVSQCEDVERALANATLFLDGFGHVVVAWLWLRQAISASAQVKRSSSADAPFYAGKVAACRFFFRYELPKALVLLDTVAQLDDTCRNLSPQDFVGH